MNPTAPATHPLMLFGGEAPKPERPERLPERLLLTLPDADEVQITHTVKTDKLRALLDDADDAAADEKKGHPHLKRFWEKFVDKFADAAALAVAAVSIVAVQDALKDDVAVPFVKERALPAVKRGARRLAGR
ncbi:MAG: hypothetical protein AB7P76_02730 [Candidatus Melainabacteria bacterium]